MKLRNVQTQISEILTLGNFIKKLQDKNKLAEQRKLNAEKRKIDRELKKNERNNKIKETQKKAKKKKISKKSRKSEKKIIRKKIKKEQELKRKLDHTEVTEWFIYKETFNEDWVQCIKCSDWAHVKCTDDENIYFTYVTCIKY
jgi:hypothetical protein